MNILIADADEETRLTLLEAIVAVLPDACVREATNGLELRRAIAETSRTSSSSRRSCRARMPR